jgi:hypothetical protein
MIIDAVTLRYPQERSAWMLFGRACNLKTAPGEDRNLALRD